jgi:hypothetical protein
MPAIALRHHQGAAVTSSALAPMPGNAPVTDPTSRPGLPRPHGYYKLDEREGFTHLALSQDNNGSEDESRTCECRLGDDARRLGEERRRRVIRVRPDVPRPARVSSALRRSHS